MIGRPRQRRESSDAPDASIDDLAIAASRLVDHLRPGRHLARRTGDADEFYDYRAYASGDPLSRIDWRAAARRDDLLVRRRRHEATMRVALLVDSSASMAFSSIQPSDLPTKMRVAQQFAAAVALVTLRQGDSLTIRTSESRASSPSVLRGRRAIGEAYSILSEIRSAGDDGAAAMFESLAQDPQKADVVFAVTDAIDDVDRLAAAMHAVASRGAEIVLIQIASPDELAPMPRGLALRDPEQRGASVVSHARPSDAAAMMADHIDVVRRSVQAHRGRHALHVTSKSPIDTLRAVLGVRR